MQERGLVPEQVTAVHPRAQYAPSFALYPAFPNPFNPETCLSFSMNSPGQVSLSVYNSSGMKVQTLMNGTHLSGSHNVYWKPENLPSGVYFIRLKTGQQTEAQKVLFLK